MKAVETPEWVKDAVFYQIFPDRFALSKQVPKGKLFPWDGPPPDKGYQGGDLLGVVEKLGYLPGGAALSVQENIPAGFYSHLEQGPRQFRLCGQFTGNSAVNPFEYTRD